MEKNIDYKNTIDCLVVNWRSGDLYPILIQVGLQWFGFVVLSPVQVFHYLDNWPVGVYSTPVSRLPDPQV